MYTNIKVSIFTKLSHFSMKPKKNVSIYLAIPATICKIKCPKTSFFFELFGSAF